MTLPLLLIAVAATAPGGHPVYPPTLGENQVESARAGVAELTAMSLEELVARVPTASGIQYCACPNCDGGTQDTGLRWSLEMGDSVRCPHCDMSFPNERYPNNREQAIVAPSGLTQVYRWHEDANGRQHFFEANAWFRRQQWLLRQALALANLYAHTQDAAYGDRAAAIVGRYAQVYPDYAVRFDYPFQPVRFYPADQTWPYEGMSPFRGAKFYWWGYGDMPTELMLAYDLLAAGDALERVEPLLGGGLRDSIENNLIRLSFRFVSANPDDYTNMSPSMYRDMVLGGRIAGAPEMVHEAVARTNALIQKQFFFDGWWRECAPSYHSQTIGGLASVADAARGYSDPHDWAGARFDNLDLRAQMPLLDKAYRAWEDSRLPDGRAVPLNDTWWSHKIAAREVSESRLWPAMGHALLGRGAGATQFQAHINWNASYGHTHYDSAALLLFAHGNELLSDIGYTHTRYRNWTINSASHNLVVVDERSQQLKHNDPAATGNLLFFDDTDPRVQALAVDCAAVYPQCDLYRRRLVHVHAGEGRDYVVDIFDVRGGTTHDYFLHGSADKEGTFESDTAFTQAVDTLVPAWGGTGEYTGENCTDVSGERFHAYWFLRDIREADGTPARWRAVWRYDNAGLESFLFPPQDGRLFCFVSPSVRRAEDHDNLLDDYLMHGIMQRHNGSESRFVAVHAPFAAEPWVTDVQVDGDAIHVVQGDVTDTVRWDATSLSVQSSAGWRYESGAPVSGNLAEVRRDGGFAFVAADGALPPSGAQYVRLDFGGARKIVYNVAGVEGNAIVLADDPGFEYAPGATEARFLYHPHEVLPGPVSWTVWRR